MSEASIAEEAQVAPEADECKGLESKDAQVN